jgi:acylphosphatase
MYRVRHISIRVSGRVQGVYFRATTKDTADGLGIKGFVSNAADGSVYIEAEGDPNQLAAFVSWCRTGPPRAQVVDAIVTEGDLKYFTDFSIQ